jgi:hypothetical protein
VPLGAPGTLALEMAAPRPLTVPPAASITPPLLFRTVPVGVVDAVEAVPPEPAPLPLPLPEPEPPEPELPPLLADDPLPPEPLLPDPLPPELLLLAVEPEPPPVVPLASPEPVLAQPPKINRPASVAEISVARWMVFMFRLPF